MLEKITAMCFATKSLEITVITLVYFYVSIGFKYRWCLLIRLTKTTLKKSSLAKYMQPYNDSRTNTRNMKNWPGECMCLDCNDAVLLCSDDVRTRLTKTTLKKSSLAKYMQPYNDSRTSTRNMDNVTLSRSISGDFSAGTDRNNCLITNGAQCYFQTCLHLSLIILYTR